MQRYWNGTLASVFKGVRGGCGGWSASPRFPGCYSLFGVFPTIFVIYSNNLSSEKLQSTSSISPL